MLLAAHAVQDLKEEVQFLIASNGKPLKVAAGHNICRQGDSADCIWLLHEGAAICLAARCFVVTLSCSHNLFSLLSQGEATGACCMLVLAFAVKSSLFSGHFPY